MHTHMMYDALDNYATPYYTCEDIDVFYINILYFIITQY